MTRATNASPVSLSVPPSSGGSATIPKHPGTGGLVSVFAEATFDGTVLKTGYVEGAVDEYLDQLSEAIGQEPTPPPER